MQSVIAPCPRKQKIRHSQEADGKRKSGHPFGYHGAGLRSLPHSRLTRQADALVLLIKGHSKLAEDLCADIPDFGEGRERNGRVGKFMPA